jgi:hypothetical protein
MLRWDDRDLEATGGAEKEAQRKMFRHSYNQR